MPDAPVVAIAPIPLARARGRLLAAPAMLALAGATAVAGGVVLSGWAGLGIAAAGGVVVVLAVALAAVVLSVRLEVQVSTLRLRWLGADRSFALVRGPVTRVPLRGRDAARIRPRFGALGWGLGRATLRGTEAIELVRLARTASVILIPTDTGRVAVAPASEEELIEALTAAARVQQRLDQVAARARSLPIPELVEPRPAEAPPEPEPGRVLTGIERVLLEERLAAERAAAIAAAEAERRTAVDEAQLAAEVAPPAPQAPPRAGHVTARLARRRIAVPRWRPPLPRASLGGVRREHLVALAWGAIPLAAGTGLWAAASIAGRLDLPPAELRLASAALALVGPLGAVAGLAVRVWFPRLTGLVTVSSLCAAALVGRALLG